MAIADYFQGHGLQQPAKTPLKYEDIPLTGEPLRDFVFYRREVGTNWSQYFLLTEEGGIAPQSVAPVGSATPLLNPIDIKDEEFGKYGPNKTRYLYAIDDEGIHVGLERSDCIAIRRALTHTNLCTKAYFGGEVFFIEPGRVILTPNSGRFGFSPGANADNGFDSYQARWKGTLDLWTALGFTVHPTVSDFTLPHVPPDRGWSGRLLIQVGQEMIAAEADAG